MGKRKRNGEGGDINGQKRRNNNGNYDTVTPDTLNHDDEKVKQAGGLFSGLSTGKIDPNYNQRGAFPGLDEDDEDGFVGPAIDGMQYLRMVRSEAKGVPTLLMANPPVFKSSARPTKRLPPRPAPIDELCYDDPPEVSLPAELAVEEPNSIAASESEAEEAGYYVDGAYIAKPELGRREYVLSAPSHPSLRMITPRAISREWHDNLIKSFMDLRQQLAQSPPPKPTGFQPLIKHEEWMRATYERKPKLSEVYAMSRTDVMRGLRIQEKFLKMGKDIGEYQGAWLYALLLRCDDVGVLANEDVSILRDLGKRAVLVMGSWSKIRVKQSEENETTAPRDWWREDEISHQILPGELEAAPESAATNKPSLLFRPRSMAVSKPAVALSTSEEVPAETTKNLVTAVVAEAILKAVQDDATDLGPVAVPMEAVIKTVTDEVKTQSPPRNPFKRDVVSEADKPKRPSVNTVYTLDMVLSLVGDFFGQKDLLLERS